MIRPRRLLLLILISLILYKLMQLENTKKINNIKKNKNKIYKKKINNSFNKKNNCTNKSQYKPINNPINDLQNSDRNLFKNNFDSFLINNTTNSDNFDDADFNVIDIQGGEPLGTSPNISNFFST